MFKFLRKCCPSDFEGVDRVEQIDEPLPISQTQNYTHNQDKFKNQHQQHTSINQAVQQPNTGVYKNGSPSACSSNTLNQNSYRTEVQASFKKFDLKQQQILNSKNSVKQNARKIRHGYRVSDLEDLPKQEQEQKIGETDQLRKSILGSGQFKVQIIWKKKSILGCGAFSTVYSGWSITHNSPIAVKEIPCRNCGNNRFKVDESQRALIQSSENEVNALRNLTHQNIVKYLGCERDISDEVVRVFMEYVGNYTLLDLVRKHGFFDEHSVANYTVQILKGLSYLHSMFIIHRDIKGSNILWSEKGDILKLADFGAATQLAQYLTTDSGSGRLYGTPQYMSPEAMRGDRVSFASDIWAVGCVVLEMLSGQVPWQRYFSNRFIAVNILSQKKSGPPIPDDVSMPCRDFLSQCFRMNPRERPTAQQLLNHSFLNQQHEQQQFQKQQNIEVARPLSAPDMTKVSTDSEIIYRTTYSSVVINQVMKTNHVDDKTQVLSRSSELGQNEMFEEQQRGNIYTSTMNPVKSYCSDKFCDSSTTDYTHVESALFNTQRYRSIQNYADSEEGSLDSVIDLLHDEGSLITKIQPDQRSSVGSKSEGSSTVLYGSVQYSPNISPQVSRTNKKEKSAINTSTDFSSAYSQFDENNTQGSSKVAQLVQIMDKQGRFPLTDAAQLLNQNDAKIQTKYQESNKNNGRERATGK